MFRYLLVGMFVFTACKARNYNDGAAVQGSSSATFFDCANPDSSFNPDNKTGGSSKAFINMTDDKVTSMTMSGDVRLTSIDVEDYVHSTSQKTGPGDDDEKAINMHTVFLAPTPLKWGSNHLGCALNVAAQKENNGWKVTVIGNYNDKSNDCQATKKQISAETSEDNEYNKVVSFFNENKLGPKSSSERNTKLNGFYASESVSSSTKSQIAASIKSFDENNAKLKKQNKPLETNLKVQVSSSLATKELISYSACKSTL